MFTTTTATRFAEDYPTVRMETDDAKRDSPLPLQLNTNAVNTPRNNQLQRLQNLTGKRAVDSTPEGVRRAAPPASRNISSETRVLFEQNRPLQQIVRYNELRLLGIPARQIILDPRNSAYQQPNESLSLTITRGDAPTLALRILNGANPNELDEHGTPALVTAAALGKDHAVRILAGAGADINARDVNQRTALLAASAAGYADTVVALLSYLPELDTTDERGMTALMHLCVQGHQTAARLLLANGANPDVSMANGDTARQLALRHGHRGIFDAPALMEDVHDNSDSESRDVDMQ